MYSEYQQMIKIPTNDQNTNCHHPPEKMLKIPKCSKYKNAQNTKMFKIPKCSKYQNGRSKYQKWAFKIPKDKFKIPNFGIMNVWYFEIWYFELDPFIATSMIVDEWK